MNYEEMNKYFVNPDDFVDVVRATVIVRYIILAQFCYSCLSSYMYFRKVHLSIKFQDEEDEDFELKTHAYIKASKWMLLIQGLLLACGPIALSSKSIMVCSGFTIAKG